MRALVALAFIFMGGVTGGGTSFSLTWADNRKNSYVTDYLEQAPYLVNIYDEGMAMLSL